MEQIFPRIGSRYVVPRQSYVAFPSKIALQYVFGPGIRNKLIKLMLSLVDSKINEKIR
jgi:hypothetical protein